MTARIPVPRDGNHVPAGIDTYDATILPEKLSHLPGTISCAAARVEDSRPWMQVESLKRSPIQFFEVRLGRAVEEIDQILAPRHFHQLVKTPVGRQSRQETFTYRPKSAEKALANLTGAHC